MTFNISEISVFAFDDISKKAAELFCDELKLRTDKDFVLSDNENSAFIFQINDTSACEDFYITEKENSIVFSAHRLRGLIYAYSMFLRKSVFSENRITLDKKISKHYSPEKTVRGHQIGYREANNTYDAWDEEQYRRYFLDLMAFGSNTYEGIPGVESEKNSLMKMSGNEMLVKTSEICMELDLDMSVWHDEKKSRDDDTAVMLAVKAYAPLPKLDIIFVPGGDPGDLMPDALFERCRKIKEAVSKYHPNIKLWISAQAPHEYPDWGEKFKEELKKSDNFPDGIIFGPNHAMTLPELNECTKGKYQLRFYPDITHNVRCEYPVHFEKNDWNYALTSTLSRESINPRPYEYKYLHKITSEYFCGSVSYSDGINDDVNKTIFGACDFDSSQTAEEILEDYTRIFIPDANAERFAQCIINLEKNWQGDPENNPQIEKTLSDIKDMGRKTPSLNENFRYVMCLFRAECDALVRRRIIFEKGLLDKAKEKINENSIDEAKIILSEDYPEDYKLLRSDISFHGKELYRLIGMQLDVENYHGKSWERGCTLETIDRPVTDRKYLLEKINQRKSCDELKQLININSVNKDEVYFSFAKDTVAALEPQVGEYYMDFDGDTPDNNGSLPVCLLNTFDHFSLRFTFDVCGDCDYRLIVTYKERKFEENAVDFSVKVNGNEIYHGIPYGGETDEELKNLLPEKYIPVSYKINKDLISDGKISVLIEEPTRGFLVSEFRIIKE